ANIPFVDSWRLAVDGAGSLVQTAAVNCQRSTGNSAARRSPRAPSGCFFVGTSLPAVDPNHAAISLGGAGSVAIAGSGEPSSVPSTGSASFAGRATGGLSFARDAPGYRSSLSASKR